MQGLDALDINAIVSKDLYLLIKLFQYLDQVVSKGVIVIN
jgi:hypothetical protein